MFETWTPGTEWLILVVDIIAIIIVVMFSNPERFNSNSRKWKPVKPMSD